MKNLLRRLQDDQVNEAVHVAAHLTVTLLVAMLCLGTGCSKKPEPPPPAVQAPPPPPPPPPQLSEAEVAILLRPHFFALFNKGFNPRMPYKYRYAAESLDFPARSSQNDGLSENFADAKASTPPADRLFQTSGNPDILRWVRYLDEQRSGEDVRNQVLRVYWLQALADAKQSNFHRAHVLFRDVADEVSRLLSAEMDDKFVRFFADVPDSARIEAFGKILETYILEQAKWVTLRGEHASVLLATQGYKDSGRFMIDELVKQLELATLPIVRQAIARGESYGFRPSGQLVAAQEKLAGLLGTLKEAQLDDASGDYRQAALTLAKDPLYLERLQTFEKTFEDKADAAQGDSASVTRQVQDLWDSSRDIGSWMKEKRICLENCPSFAVRPGMVLKPELFCPATWDGTNEVIVHRYGEYFGDSEVQAVTAWCNDEKQPFPLGTGDRDKVLDDGAAHFVLGWYFLENSDRESPEALRSNPVAARRAFLQGASLLLEGARSADRDAMLRSKDSGRKELRQTLLKELNGIQLLIAASAISVAPPGASSSGGSYLSELDVLLYAWRQVWLSAGLPEDAARASLENCREMIKEIRALNAVAAAPEDRYFFADYRFRHGDVPDVLVDEVVDQMMFRHDGTTWYGLDWRAAHKAPFPLIEWLDEIAEKEHGFSEESIARFRAGSRDVQAVK
jgi:hypothetical protein